VITLDDGQAEAVSKLKTGSVLVGGTGSGKSITALWYFTKIDPHKKIVILTTAKKRDSGEWWGDAMKMSLTNELVVDSWNNIKKYEDWEDCFFILDEQRVVGYGAWSQSFFKIAAKNPWILLSATPADMWIDLMPVFIANGFYKNKTEFTNRHVKWSRFAKYPKIDGYYDTWQLDAHRKSIFVELPYVSPATRHEHIVNVDFNLDEQTLLYKDRWNFEENVPLKDAGEMMRYMRKSANLDPSRALALLDILKNHDRVIVFYNHNYELEELRCLHTELDIPVAEWNGHNHQDIPKTEKWLYLVQYQAGSEGWNCITTDTMVFWSLPYSYRQFEQAKGRIDRKNTPFLDLHYYIFKSRAIIDQAIWKALNRKKNFQAGAFAKKNWKAPPLVAGTPL
jgi:hypothetical protein